jgi:hypothetical protein
VAAPVTAFPDAGQHWTNHAYQRQQSYHWEEPGQDDVGNDNPVEWQPWGGKMPMESFLCHLLCLLVFCELIFLSQLCLLFFIQTCEVSLPTWTEIDVPAPELTQHGIGLLIVMCSEFAILALMCHNIIFLCF